MSLPLEGEGGTLVPDEVTPAVTEKEAFLSGVRFAARFFLESMCP